MRCRSARCPARAGRRRAPRVCRTPPRSASIPEQSCSRGRRRFVRPRAGYDSSEKVAARHLGHPFDGDPGNFACNGQRDRGSRASCSTVCLRLHRRRRCVRQMIYKSCTTRGQTVQRVTAYLMRITVVNIAGSGGVDRGRGHDLPRTRAGWHRRRVEYQSRRPPSTVEAQCAARSKNIEFRIP